MKQFKKVLKEEIGATVIEVAVVIVIMIVLALIFQEQIIGVLLSIIAKIDTKINEVGSVGIIWFQSV